MSAHPPRAGSKIVAVVTIGGEANARDAIIFSRHRTITAARRVARRLIAAGEKSAAPEWVSHFVAAGGVLS